MKKIPTSMTDVYMPFRFAFFFGAAHMFSDSTKKTAS